jgi:asparagine synthase (glutamine-hydrolysing)
MSAIAGIYQINNQPITKEHSLGMMNALKKYPADDVQLWTKENIFFGCHAQWITPESVGEQLPLHIPEKQLVITADAIIDNREELFEYLSIEKSRRKDLTDSELIALSYLKWGEDCPKYLIGDFAFMIWDERRRKLFGARDFSGSRTLYYYYNNKQFAFCTVIQPLLTLPFIKKILNEQWLAEFLAIPDMFNTVNTSSTVYQKIEQIPPSHAISLVDGKVKISRYSKVIPEEKLRLNSNEEYEEAFKEVFQTAVESRLRTTHNVGAHLSGGLDSGSVVGFAAKSLKKVNKKLYTFSYVPIDNFTDWTPKNRLADERPLIKQTVQHVGNIDDYYLDFNKRSSFSEIDDWLETLEMPYKFFENSYWMSGVYEAASKQGIKLLLNGARGNYTISWGSAMDYYARLMKNLRWIQLYNEINQYIYNRGTGRKKLLSQIGKRAFPTINKWFTSKADYSFPILINPDFAQKSNVFSNLEKCGVDVTGSIIPNTYEMRINQFEKLHSWGNGTSGTKLSLRYSLWNRDPTNDLRVIRFCLSVPDSQYIQKGIDRSLVRRSTKNLLPDKVRLNQRIRGVQGADGIQRMAPEWGKLISELEELVEDPIISKYVNIEVIKTAIARVKQDTSPELIFDPEFKILMRGLIVYRFIKSF